MKYLHRFVLRLPAAALLAALATVARADLVVPDRFTPADAPRLGELRWSIQAAGDHRVVLGAGLQRPGANAPIVPQGRGWQVGVWAQDEWRLAESLVTISGLRIERDDAGIRRVSPRTALRWQPGGGLELRAELERAERLPTAFDVDDTALAPAGPPVGTTRLVGEQRLPGDWLLRAAASRARWRDAVVVGVDPASGLPQLDAGSGGTVRGATLALARRWPDGTRVEAGLAVQALDNADGRAAPEAARGQGRLAVEVPVGPVQVGARWVAESARPAWDGSVRPGSGRLDLSLQTELPGSGVGLSVGVANVGDTGEADRRQLHFDARLRF